MGPRPDDRFGLLLSHILTVAVSGLAVLGGLLVRRRDDLRRLWTLTVKNVRGEPMPDPGRAD